MNNCGGQIPEQENPLLDKSVAFAMRIIKLYRLLRKSGEDVMSKQLLRSGTSVGANIAEAQYAQSKADFTTKLSIALKESSETRYWLTLLIESGTLKKSASSNSLIAECEELIKLLIASVKTAKKI